MTHQLIITEKPSAAKKIANALAEGAVKRRSKNKVSYYELERDGKKITVVAAVGHLFTVAEKNKSFEYPSFNIKWKPSYKEDKGARYTKKYADVIKKQAEDADSFVVACDYDVEGEVIGLNVVRFLCDEDDAKRMKFSTLTKSDLVEAYNNLNKSIDWGQAKAGETRHFLDWLYGINLSRALTLAIRRNKAYGTMSAGRVQGPALKILVEKEKEIRKFVSKPYWELDLYGESTKKDKIEASHKSKRFWKEEKADDVLKKTKGKNGEITDIERKKKKIPPPKPFDLTSLQTEAYKVLGIRPKTTLELAQELYSKGYISYPRTSSQQLPAKLGYKKIISKLAKQDNYEKLGKMLLDKKYLKPNNGKKTDPAHPAIYPTGEFPKGSKGREWKVYDLIVKRFFATFGEWALRERIRLSIDVNTEIFIAKGVRTVKKGWNVLYEPYVRTKEKLLPDLKEGEKIIVKKIDKVEKETQPPRRYSQASIISELEKKGLGTKATRAQIIENLYDREYIKGKSIEVTDFGIQTIDTLEKNVPKIIDEEMTRQFDRDMKRIRADKVKPKEVLEKAKKELKKVLEEFQKKEDKIGKELADAYLRTERKKNLIGKCPKCKKGELLIKRSRRKQRFIACDQYPDCKNTYSIPQGGKITKTDKICEECSSPIIKIRKGRKVQEVCINKNCGKKTKEIERVKENLENGNREKKCPKCKKGELVVRNSVYGSFLGCSNYPKCRYTEKLNKDKKEDKNKKK